MAMDVQTSIDCIDAAAKTFGIKRLTPMLGEKAESTLRAELNGTRTYKLGWKTAWRVMETVDDFSAVIGLMREAGYECFRVPRDVPDNFKPVLDHIAKLTKEYGESITASTAAIADGKITREEAEKNIDEAADIINAAIQLKSYWENRLKETK
jgi:hypothetical protein